MRYYQFTKTFYLATKSLEDLRPIEQPEVEISESRIEPLFEQVFTTSGVRTGGFRGSKPPRIEDFKRNENLFWERTAFFHTEIAETALVFLCYPTCL